MKLGDWLAQEDVVPARVLGGSMYPVLNTGDLVLVRPGSCKPGDIIAFRYKGYVMTHRLLQMEPEIVTKGDNVPACDDRVIGSEDIIGRAFAVYRPSLGRVIPLDHKFTDPRYLRYAKLEARLGSTLARLRRKPSQSLAKRLLTPLYYGWVFRYANQFQKKKPAHV